MPYFTKIILKRYLRLPTDFVVPLGPIQQRGSLMAAVYLEPLWRREKFSRKLKALLLRRWRPDNEVMQEAAKKVFMTDVFGLPDDFGNELFVLHHWHEHRVWKYDHLLPADFEKSKGIQGARLLTALRHRNKGTNEHLHLRLNLFSPLICSLVEPIIIKLPIISIRFGLELSEEFAFNSIREAKHPYADDLVSYLYEVLVIQQKVATAFHELLTLISEIQSKSSTSILLLEEVEAVTLIDNLINYLKATIEKLIVILGLTHGKTKLEESKNHSAKLNALDAAIPKEIQELPYYKFVRQYISSEEIIELNNLRNGINHKKGISKLQPHTFADLPGNENPLTELFDTLMDQHRKNTAVAIGILALLTDDLMKKCPPDLSTFPVPKFKDTE